MLATNKEASNLVLKDMTPLLKLGSFKSKEFGYYQLSGTSMASAEVSGLVALLLQKDPTLTNDQVKYRLTGTAKAAGSASGAVYSVWQQGAGKVDALGAYNGTSTESANVGMDIAQDLQGETGTHYVGTSEYDAATNSFYFAGQPVATGSYQAWGGSYQAWGGSYQAWGGSYQAWGGSYQAWGGSYQAWGGSYQAWGGSYQAWGGSYQAWGGSYQAWGGTITNP